MQGGACPASRPVQGNSQMRTISQDLADQPGEDPRGPTSTKSRAPARYIASPHLRNRTGETRCSARRPAMTSGSLG